MTLPFNNSNTATAAATALLLLLFFCGDLDFIFSHFAFFHHTELQTQICTASIRKHITCDRAKKEEDINNKMYRGYLHSWMKNYVGKHGWVMMKRISSRSCLQFINIVINISTSSTAQQIHVHMNSAECMERAARAAKNMHETRINSSSNGFIHFFLFSTHIANKNKK